ncbi:hypothetical protein, partial [Skermanella aerolata]|uniref:hypothetical protein n=1 Tax=Skermanella aerolata TaxID=393310 RepID=UPI001B3B5E7B
PGCRLLLHSGGIAPTNMAISNDQRIRVCWVGVILGFGSGAFFSPPEEHTSERCSGRGFAA